MAAAAVILSACSTQKNTSGTRFWHSFNAKYNTYYNGAQAYIDGSLEKEQGNKDNFTEMIPLYTVGNKNSRDLGKANFDRAIEKAEKAIARHSIKKRPVWTKNRRKTEKDIEWLNRREYNPFLWKAWMLMGRAQFHKGSFDEAAATFAYMSRLYQTQPAIYGKARAWLAKCYTEQEWYYDAEDVIRNMQRDSVDWRAQKEWDYTYADYYIHTKEFEKAIPYLRKVIKHEMRRKQKAREWYLMGQIQAALGNRTEAYKAFKHVMRENPPYELEFNARIAMTEVMAAGQSKQMISRLKRMAASDNNKEYLDQVYYAMGNIYLADKDTMQAISAYEQGNKKATRSGIEKGVLLLHLGDLYWAKEKFSDARRCYGEAIGLLDKDRDDYEQLSTRSRVLDELVPYTDAVQLQDSLQYLAKAPEDVRNAAIDRVIDELKRKEKEERDARAEQEANQQNQNNSGNPNMPQTTTNTPGTQQGGAWYFYNPMTVNQGKSTFQRQWGRRENVDDWQRANKTVVGNIGSNADIEELTDAQRDSIFKAEQLQDSLSQKMDSAQNNPHRREYYLAQIPFTGEQMAASNKILEDGLHHSGVIFKDRLDNLRLAEKNLRRLADNYTDYEQMDDVLYHLYLLYMRRGEPEIANQYIERLRRQYPKSEWTAILTDPYFRENARFGVQIEDSLYAATYDAFKAGRYQEVRGNVSVSASRFPLGANRDKFLFIGGLSKLNDGDATGCINDMKTVVDKYPNSRISEMAGMIVNGVQAGRKLYGGRFDLGDVWSRRTDVLNDSDSIRQVTFSKERDIDFKVLLAYRPDSLDENKLLFEMARFNFTHFVVRNFDIEILNSNDRHLMQLSGFRSFDEAYQYAREMVATRSIAEQMNKNTRVIIISTKNLDMVGLQFTFEDYQKFYEKYFAPLQISKRYLLSEPAEVASPRERDLDEEIDNRASTLDDINASGGEVPADNSFTIPEEVVQPEQQSEEPAGITVPQQPEDVPQEPEQQPATPQIQPETPQAQPQEPEQKPESPATVEPVPEDNGIVVPDDNGFTIPDDNTTVIEDDNSLSIPEENIFTVPEEEQREPQNNTIEVPAPQQPAIPQRPDNDAQPRQNTTQQPTPQQPKSQPQQQPATPAEEQPVEDTQDDTGIYFDDDIGEEPSNNNAPKQNDNNIEDEYYDLDGF